MKSKVVFDTNIYISAVIFGGNPRSCLELARKGEVELFTSSAIILEISKKLKNKFKWKDEEVFEVIEGLSKFIKKVTPQEKLSVIKTDPTDNKILECAKEAKTDFIVSGDVKHLLSLKNFGKIKIVSTKQFLDIFYQKTK